MNLYVKFNPDFTVEKYPCLLTDLCKDNPHVSFPTEFSQELLASFGVSAVVYTPAQFDSTIQVATENGCAYSEERQQWETSWMVRGKTTEELAADTQYIKSVIVDQTQQRLDNFAKTRGYDGILSACTYATSTVPKFQQEGQYCVTARDSTWAGLYQILSEVEAGTRLMPAGFADIEPLLPKLSWPT